VEAVKLVVAALAPEAESVTTMTPGKIVADYVSMKSSSTVIVDASADGESTCTRDIETRRCRKLTGVGACLPDIGQLNIFSGYQRKEESVVSQTELVDHFGGEHAGQA